jgi:predicted acyltransferase
MDTLTLTDRQSESTPAPLTQTALPATAQTQRLLSLDIFRGLTIAGMLLVNNPGHGKAYGPLEHADWNGWTPTDLIFPFFLFIVGVAIPFSMSRRAAASQTRRQLLGRIALRALALFMLGALIHGFAYTAVSLNLGPRDAATPLFSLGALPDGLVFLKTLRAIAWGFIPLGMLALLIPWRSRRAQWIVPVAVTVIFYLLMFAIVFANRRAWASGLAFDTNLGGGIFRPDTYRIPGILQRIAICYAAAATLALFVGPRLLLTALILLLSIYSALMLMHIDGSPTFNGSLTREDNLARRIDVAVFDHPRAADGSGLEWKHTYGKYPDPEGLLSTLPAIGTAILGVLVGIRLRKDTPAAHRAAQLLASGVIVTLLGVAADAWLIPINKSIWTPSFVLFCGGMAMLGLGTLFYLTDVRGTRDTAHERRRPPLWSLPLVIYGKNAIAAFVAAALLVRVAHIIKVQAPENPLHHQTLSAAVQSHIVTHFDQANAWLQEHGHYFPTLNAPANTSLAYALLFVLTIFILMTLLYVCRIFVKV